jgi:NTP pyrophosphatase (non-canonical NTP hydrolase)
VTFNEYQKAALKTDVFEGERSIDSHAFIAKLLGLVGETGEVAEKFKKIFRDKGGKISPEEIEEMKKELGDILWYVATVAAYLDIELDEAATKNIEKLASRHSRGVLRGSGDNR